MAKPWASFCISTYRRPEILKAQLTLLLQQEHPDFEIVISDNDPEGSAGPVVDALQDARIKYARNETNLGMIRSFNRSIDRAQGEFIVPVTDDDPVDKEFLKVFSELANSNPGFSIYGGLRRAQVTDAAVEKIPAEKFISEILHPAKTTTLLWSSCLFRRADALVINKIPDYGSPHLADHAFLAMTGAVNGGLIVNKMYSQLTSHDTNFSKSNFQLYTDACSGFQKTMRLFLKSHPAVSGTEKVINRHMGDWFVRNYFSLKKYFAVLKPDGDALKELEKMSAKIRSFDFMKDHRMYFLGKNLLFGVKKAFRLF